MWCRSPATWRVSDTSSVRTNDPISLSPRAARQQLYGDLRIEGDLTEIFAAREAALKEGVQETRSDSVNPDYVGYTGYLWVPMGPRLTHADVTRG